MSEVKGILGSTDSSSPTQPSSNTMPNITSASHEVNEKPLASTAPVLHPLPKDQTAHAQTHTSTPTATQPVVTKTSAQSSNNIQFNSAVGSKNSQKINPFAEQNAKRAEKEKKRAKNRKSITIITTTIATVLLITAITWTIIINLNKQNPKDPEIQVTIAEDTYNEALEAIENSVSETPEESIEEATQIFDQAINKALKDKNPELADVLRIAQMRLYINSGIFSNHIIELSEQINDVSSLPPLEQIKYYNFLAQTYSNKGDNEQAQKYYRLAAEAGTQIENYGG